MKNSRVCVKTCRCPAVDGSSGPARLVGGDNFRILLQKHQSSSLEDLAPALLEGSVKRRVPSRHFSISAVSLVFIVLLPSCWQDISAKCSGGVGLGVGVVEHRFGLTCLRSLPGEVGVGRLWDSGGTVGRV